MSSKNELPSKRTTDDGPTDGPALDDDCPDSVRDRRVGRRTFVKGIGASTVAAAGLSSEYTGSANAIVVSGTVLAGAAGVAAGAGLAYLATKAADKYLGDSRDYSGYTGATALATEITTGLVQMKSADERVMTSIQNNLTNSQNIGLAKGKAAAIEVMNAGGTESEATTAVQEAIDGYYVTIEKNLITHNNAQVDQVAHMADQLSAHSNASVSDVFFSSRAGSSVDSESYSLTLSPGQNTHTFIDGTTAPQKYITASVGNVGSGQFSLLYEDTAAGGNGSYNFKFKNDGTKTDVFDGTNMNILSNVAAERDDVNAQLSGFVTDVYANYAAGDIPTEDLVDPITLATEMGQNTGLSSQAAEAAVLGIPTSAGFSVWLELQDSDGTKYEVEAEMFTKASPTDGSGNETGFQVGTTYDPANYTEPIYVAYEHVDPETDEATTDFIQVEHPFTVLEATASDGSSLNTVRNEQRINQTADITKLEAELKQLRDEQQRLQEASQTGGGLSLDGLAMFGLPGEVVALGAAAIAAFMASK